jgi:hypothetical protein
MGEFAWGTHYTPITEGLKLQLEGVHRDKSGNYTEYDMHQDLKLPFKKGYIAYKIWHYLFNRYKPAEIYIYKLNF